MSLFERLEIHVQKKCPPGFHKNRKTGKCERIRIDVRPREDTSLYARLMEAPDCGDRMRDNYRPDAKQLEKTKYTANRMSDNARALKAALMCREKKNIDRLMTQMGKDLVSIKNALNSKEGKRALDYEADLMNPKRKVKARELVRSSR
jgi:hypothetical protein